MPHLGDSVLSVSTNRYLIDILFDTYFGQFNVRIALILFELTDCVPCYEKKEEAKEYAKD